MSDGGAAITKRGICWSLYPNPTVGSNNFTTDGVGTGSFVSKDLYSLKPKTLYYVRAYATNAVGTFYGDTRTVTTLPNCTNLTDTCTVSSSYGNIPGHGGRVYEYNSKITFKLYNLNLPIPCNTHLQFDGYLNCKNSTFNIPSQTSSGCIISGSGFYNSTFDQLTVTYTIVSNGKTHNCTSVFTHWP